MFTANSMASCIEALGMSLPGTSSTVASGWNELAQPRLPYGAHRLSEAKKDDCRATVEALFGLLRSKVQARDIMTREAFENAIVVLYVELRPCIHVALASGFDIHKFYRLVVLNLWYRYWH